MKKISLLIFSICLITLLGANFLFSQGVAANLNNVIVYPNPCILSKGHNQVIFSHLTEEVTIKIYNLKGKLITDESITDNTSGMVAWDVTNNSEEKVGSGIYLYLITNLKGEKATGKIVIIR
ncbi:T9SS type A sorting domain-containing protein [bacterium]|nr:T9SS type A sorting domain-containing protein [bacterium]